MFFFFFFFKYAFLFVMVRSMQVGDRLKQIGFYIRCSELKEPAKSCKFLSSGVTLKSPNNITFSYVSKYMEKILDKLSKNADLLWSGGLYVPTINHFLKRRSISRKRVSLNSIVNQVIKTISSLFIFLTKKIKRTKTQIKPKSTYKIKISKQKTTKATVFRAQKLLGGRNCLFCVLVLFLRSKPFRRKKQTGLKWSWQPHLHYY